MWRVIFMITVIMVACSSAAETLQPVTFESLCLCRDNHGKARLAVKEDPSTPAPDASAGPASAYR